MKDIQGLSPTNSSQHPANIEKETTQSLYSSHTPLKAITIIFLKGSEATWGTVPAFV